MRVLILILAFVFSGVTLSREVDLREFTLDVKENWIVNKNSVGIEISFPGNRNVVTLSPFRIPEEATTQDVIEKDGESQYSDVGIFKLSEGKSQFNIYEGTYKNSWLAYSKDIVLLVTYVSYDEISSDMQVLIKDLLKSVKWKKP